jgi:hypothetical protein
VSKYLFSNLLFGNDYYSATLSIVVCGWYRIRQGYNMGSLSLVGQPERVQNGVSVRCKRRGKKMGKKSVKNWCKLFPLRGAKRQMSLPVRLKVLVLTGLSEPRRNIFLTENNCIGVAYNV